MQQGAIVLLETYNDKTVALCFLSTRCLKVVHCSFLHFLCVCAAFGDVLHLHLESKSDQVTTPHLACVKYGFNRLYAILYCHDLLQLYYITRHPNYYTVCLRASQFNKDVSVIH